MKFRTLAAFSHGFYSLFILCVMWWAGRRSLTRLHRQAVSPADGAGVAEPFTISWTAVSDPTGHHRL
jgi:hypothetical protein